VTEAVEGVRRAWRSDGARPGVAVGPRSGWVRLL